MTWLDRVIVGGAGGRVAVVVQDATSGAVLRVGHADARALRSMHESGLVTLLSPEGAGRYVCGETDGVLMRVAEILLSVDCDALVVRVRAARPGGVLSGCFEVVENRHW